MKNVIDIMKKEAVLITAAICALITCIFVPPSGEYAGYIDYRVIGLLMTLMIVVAGLSKLKLFDLAAEWLIGMTKGSMLKLSITLWGICFVSAMFITNDVALITFVPLCINTLNMCGKKKYIIYNVVLQTIAANLGSMLTPIGNPQNLYIYSYYDVSIPEFVKITLPIIVVSIIMLIIMSLPMVRDKVDNEYVTKTENYTINKKILGMYIFFGLLAVLAVCKLVNYVMVWGIAVFCAFLFDRKVLRKVDYSLLITFIMFFIFVGNIGNIAIVRDTMSGMIDGKVLEMSIVLSQVISNVPAAVMLSGFTEDYVMLIKGVNIGGLGTLIASMASLISFRLYSQQENCDKMRYILTFSGINIIFLLILYVTCIII